MLRDEHERRLHADEPSPEGVREPVSLVEAEEQGAVKARARVARQAREAPEVDPVRREGVGGDDSGAEFVLAANLDAVRDDDLAARARAAEGGDARENLLDEPRRGVRPMGAEGRKGGGV